MHSKLAQAHTQTDSVQRKQTMVCGAPLRSMPIGQCAECVFVLLRCCRCTMAKSARDQALELERCYTVRVHARLCLHGESDVQVLRLRSSWSKHKTYSPKDSHTRRRMSLTALRCIPSRSQCIANAVAVPRPRRTSLPFSTAFRCSQTNSRLRWFVSTCFIELIVTVCILFDNSLAFCFNRVSWIPTPLFLRFAGGTSRSCSVSWRRRAQGCGQAASTASNE